MTTLRNKNNAIALLDNLREFGYTDSQMLNMIMNDFLSGNQAYDAVEHLYNEFGLNEDEDETNENEETDEEILNKYQ
jgi:ribosome assembly protein YihI (activator of Der GTPase)